MDNNCISNPQLLRYQSPSIPACFDASLVYQSHLPVIDFIIRLSNTTSNQGITTVSPNYTFFASKNIFQNEDNIALVIFYFFNQLFEWF